MHPYITAEVASLAEDVRTWRRHLHQNPELSFEEFSTTSYIEKKLREFGIESIDRPTKTGLVAHVIGELPGIPKSVAIRADIDALPMPEENDLPYASTVKNVMHACGHDGHTAMLLGVAKLLSESKASFCGEARLIFQHAEELPPGGAIEMQQAGVMNGVDALLGLHLSSQYPTCVFGVKSGPLTANVDRFDIIVTGRGGHCALPEECIDPIVVASELVISLQTIVSRRIAAIEPAVLSVCHLVAGTAYNIIPSEALLSGTVRSFSKEARAHIEQEIRRVARGIAEAAGAHADVKWTSGYPAVYNDPALTETANTVISNRFTPSGRMDISCITPGEDFSYFEEHCPGFFVELGTRNPEKLCDRPHHNPHYRMDEDALPVGMQYELDMIRYLLDGAGTHLPRR